MVSMSPTCFFRFLKRSSNFKPFCFSIYFKSVGSIGSVDVLYSSLVLVLTYVLGESPLASSFFFAIYSALFNVSKYKTSPAFTLSTKVGRGNINSFSRNFHSSSVKLARPPLSSDTRLSISLFAFSVSAIIFCSCFSALYKGILPFLIFSVLIRSSSSSLSFCSASSSDLSKEVVQEFHSENSCPLLVIASLA